MRARRDDNKMSSQTSRYGKSVLAFASKPATEPPSVTAVITETVERTDEITSTASTTQGRPPVTGMEGIERGVETDLNVMLSAKAENTAAAAAKLIVRPSTLFEAVAGKRKFEGIQEKSSLPRQSIEEEDTSIIAPILFSGEKQTQKIGAVQLYVTEWIYSSEITGPQFWTDDDDDDKLTSPQSRGQRLQMKKCSGTISQQKTESVKLIQIMIVHQLFQTRQVCVMYMKKVKNFS
jgi:hypothetical protein